MAEVAKNIIFMGALSASLFPKIIIQEGAASRRITAYRKKSLLFLKTTFLKYFLLATGTLGKRPAAHHIYRRHKVGNITFGSILYFLHNRKHGDHPIVPVQKVIKMLS